MRYNKNKIIRSVTVPQSLDFCREVMIKMRAMGYDMVAVTSPGPELDELRDVDGFHRVAVPMERHISILSILVNIVFSCISFLMKFGKPAIPYWQIRYIISTR